MPLLAGEYRKTEKIDGTIYDLSPSPNYLHGVVNNNINTMIKNKLKGSLYLVFMENLDFQYQPETTDNYVIPDIMIVCDRNKIKGGISLSKKTSTRHPAYLNTGSYRPRNAACRSTILTTADMHLPTAISWRMILTASIITLILSSV